MDVDGGSAEAIHARVIRSDIAAGACRISDHFAGAGCPVRLTIAIISNDGMGIYVQRQPTVTLTYLNAPRDANGCNGRSTLT